MKPSFKKKSPGKMKSELHPLGTGIFQIVEFTKNDHGGTLVFKSLLERTLSIPRTFYTYKKCDLEELQSYGCNTESIEDIHQFLSSLKGRLVSGTVVPAKNPRYRNIESFNVIEPISLDQNGTSLY
jgi:hypothetical protein